MKQYSVYLLESVIYRCIVEAESEEKALEIVKGSDFEDLDISQVDSDFQVTEIEEWKGKP